MIRWHVIAVFESFVYFNVKSVASNGLSATLGSKVNMQKQCSF